MRSTFGIMAVVVLGIPLLAAAARKTEKPANFIPAVDDPVMGDWAGSASGGVAQVLPLGDGKYQATLLKQFDTENNLTAVLQGTRAGDTINFQGNGWTGAIDHGQFTCGKGDERLDLHHITRTSPTVNAPPPTGAIVLFDGHNLDAWSKKNAKQWLTEDGPAKWKLLDGGVAEVVPETDCIITHRKFGDCKVHVEFRTLGYPSNSGVFLETRYEVNINETYGRPDSSPNAGFDNCTDLKPRVRPCFPPLAWQTFDIDFRAPRFDSAGKRIAKARATVLFNGVKVWDDQELEIPHGAASRLGEAPTGPLMLQEHGMPVQFRNIWLLETTH